MKNILTGILLTMLTLGLNAQMITVNVATLTANPGDIVNVPVVITGAGSSGSPVSVCDVNITYDDAVLDFIGLVNFYPTLPESEWIYSGNLSMLSANWLEPNFGTEAIADGSVLFEMQFTYVGGNSDLIFIKNEFYDAAYELIPTTPQNGAINSVVIQRDVAFSVDMTRQTVSPDGVHLAGSFNNWDCSANPMINDGTGVYSTTVPLAENANYTYRFVNGNNTAGLESVPQECGTPGGSGENERTLALQAADTVMNLVCFSSCDICPALHNVTFRVDMINQSASADGIHLAGTFNNWNYSSTAMILTGGGAVYEVSLALEEGQYHEFRFINGNSAGDTEIVPEGCAANGNRYMTVPAGNLSLDALCYGECVECGNLPLFYNLTFRVDMKNETVSPEGMHIAGSFQGWLPGTTPMSAEGNNIFSYTATLLENSSVEYRFVNGNSSTGYETVPVECAVNGNRNFSSISSDTLLPVVCFSECDTCMQPEVLVTFRVDMSDAVISPDGMHLAGSFQGWNPDGIPMDGGDNIFTATVSLPVGSYQEYRFVNGNTMAGYENVPVECAAGDNRYLTIPVSDTVLTPVCLNSCEPCSTGVAFENAQHTFFRIFPNPSKGDVSLGFYSVNACSISFSVFNGIGRKVFESEVTDYPGGQYTIPLNAEGLPEGIYLVIVKNALNSDISKEKLILVK